VLRFSSCPSEATRSPAGLRSTRSSRTGNLCWRLTRVSSKLATGWTTTSTCRTVELLAQLAPPVLLALQALRGLRVLRAQPARLVRRVRLSISWAPLPRKVIYRPAETSTTLTSSRPTATSTFGMGLTGTTSVRS